MPHWRNLLHLGLALLALRCAGAPGNIQGRPTPTIYQTIVARIVDTSSYDGFSEYTPLAALNGLTNALPANLGAAFHHSAYVDKIITFPTTIAYDNTVFDPVGSPLNGVVGPVGWAGAYVGRVNFFPKLTYDDLASYQSPASLSGLAGGADNGAGIVWSGAYVQGGPQPPLPGTCTPPGNSVVSITSLGTTVSDSYYAGAANPNVHGGAFGYQFLPTRDFLVTGLGLYNLSGQAGSCSVNYVYVQITGNSIQTAALVPVSGVPTGQFNYACLGAPFLCKAGVPYNVVAFESSAGGCATPFPGSNSVFASTYVGVQGPYTFGSCVSLGNYFVAATNTGFVPIDMLTDEGVTWSNQVVLNGGAAPSTATTTAISTFTKGLIADGLWANFQSVNPLAPDSLIAAQTPIPALSPAGAQPYVNHNFVGGDVSVNGLTGNGTTKYLDSGFNPATVFGSGFGGYSVYGYTVTGTGGATAVTIDTGAPAKRFGIFCKFLDTHAYGQNSTSLLDAGVSPGNGFYSDSRTGSTAHILYFANSGSAWASIGSEATAFTSYPSLNVYVNAANNPGSGGAALWSVGPISYVSFRSGVSSADGQAEYNRVQTLRTTLGGGFR